MNTQDSHKEEEREIVVTNIRGRIGPRAGVATFSNGKPITETYYLV